MQDALLPVVYRPEHPLALYPMPPDLVGLVSAFEFVHEWVPLSCAKMPPIIFTPSTPSNAGRTQA
jgi:hypothetical protein